jgi:hypothetical protein
MNKKIIVSLISFVSVLAFVSPISATTIFSEDFESFNIGDSATELASSDNWVLVNSSYLRFLVSDDWYSSSSKSLMLNDTDSYLSSKLFDTITSGSLFYSIKFDGSYAHNNTYLLSGSSDTWNNYISINMRNNSNNGLIEIASYYDGSVLASLPIVDNYQYDVRVDFNVISSKISITINDTLVIDNDTLDRDYKFGNVSGINSLKIRLAKSPYPNPPDLFIDDIYLTDIGDNPFVVNGSCGSANNSSFSVFPSDNLCSSGVICSGQPYTDGTYYYWTCYGYGSGATSEDCKASVLVSTAQCGYLANTQYSDSSPPSGSNACLSGSVRDMLQLDDDSWLWYCEVSDDDFVPCSTFSDNPIVITPSLPSSPDIACEDILTGQGFANCVSSVFAWLFLPHQDTIDEFFQLSSLMKTKIPFGYVYSFRDEINNLTSNSPSDFSVALTFNGDDQIPVVNSDTFDILGSDFKSTYFRFIRAILWISFGVWVFTLGRKLFLNNRDS